MAGMGMGETSRRRKRRTVVCGAAVAGLMLFIVAPVIGNGQNSRPVPAPQLIAATHPATSVQVAGASGLADISSDSPASSKKKTHAVLRRVAISSRITDQEILTEEGKGTFVGIKCPPGSKAISGGVLTKYINLLVSSSAPNNPITRKYTPNTWWLTVTNVNVDGNGGTLAWQGVVNCISPARLGTGT